MQNKNWVPSLTNARNYRFRCGISECVILTALICRKLRKGFKVTLSSFNRRLVHSSVASCLAAETTGFNYSCMLTLCKFHKARIFTYTILIELHLQQIVHDTLVVITLLLGAMIIGFILFIMSLF